MIIDVFSKPDFVNIRMFKTILQFIDNENKNLKIILVVIQFSFSCFFQRMLKNSTDNKCKQIETINILYPIKTVVAFQQKCCFLSAQ